MFTRRWQLGAVALLLFAIRAWHSGARQEALQDRADGVHLAISNTRAAPPSSAAAKPDPEGSAWMSRMAGITQFSLLSTNQERNFREVVVPGVQRFLSVLEAHNVSRFSAQPIGPDNFISLHEPKPGGVWDLKLAGNNGRDYFMRFNQTRELGLVKGLTNVVCFFPMSGRSIQGVMEGFVPARPGDYPAVEIRPRQEIGPEEGLGSVAGAILGDLGNDPQGFLRMFASTERASGVKGGHLVTFRPKGLTAPDNALYDTTFGFIPSASGFVVDTFTYNSARLTPPDRRRAPATPKGVPSF